MNEHPGEKKIPEAGAAPLAEAAPLTELTVEELDSVSGGVNGTGGIHIREDWNDIAHPLAEP